jgi:hypothetical protein
MIDASKIVSALGAKEIGAAVGLRHSSAVYNAAADGSFPASWFRSLRDMCEEVGIECPEELFNWKAPVEGNVSGTCREVAS